MKRINATSFSTIADFRAARRSMEAARASLISLYNTARGEDNTPAATVAGYVAEVGYETAVTTIAEIVNAVGDWDERVSRKNRRWAVSLPNVADRKTLTDAGYYAPSDIHPCHIDQLADAMREYRPDNTDLRPVVPESSDMVTTTAEARIYGKAKGGRAVAAFVRAVPAAADWADVFKWMWDAGITEYTDDILADGTPNTQWCYMLQFYPVGDGCYISIITRDNAPESPAEAPTSPESPAVDETPAEAPKAPEIAAESPKAAGKEEPRKSYNVRRISRGIGRIRKSPKYCAALQRKGNTKLTDYKNIRYAQFNTRALIDCPFKSAGCTEFCYANKGLHVMPSVKKSREKSHLESIREDFAARMIYAIHAEITHSRRYGGDNIMMCRIHESGDFFHIEYLRKWVKVWKWATRYARGKVVFPLYTKSTPLFNALSPEDRAAVNEAMEAGVLALNASYDDTYTAAAQKALARFLALYPLANLYIASNDDSHPHNHDCDCENCGKCGKCNHADARRTLVHIH